MVLQHGNGSSFGGWSTALAIVGAIVFAVLAIGHGPDSEAHEAILTALRSVDMDNAALQRDVLQARARVIETYEPLEASITELQAAVVTLRQLYEGPNGEIDPSLAPLLDRLNQRAFGDSILVRDFEWQNTLLEKAIVAFGRELSAVHNNALQSKGSVEFPSSDVGNLMMQYTHHADPALASLLNKKFDLMDQANPARESIFHSLVKHGRTIVTALPQINETIRRIQASDTGARAQDLQQEYLRAYDEISARAGLVRIFLGTASVVLCVYVAFLVYRLRMQTGKLSRRLAFETTIVSVRRCFEGAGEAEIEKAVRCAVETVLSFFDAQSYDLMILAMPEGEIQSRYRGPGIRAPATQLSIRCIVNELRNAKKSSELRRPIYRNLHRHDEPLFAREGLSAGVCVAASPSDSQSFIFIIEYDHTRRRVGTDEILLLEAALTAIVRGIDESRKRNERKALERRLEHAERLQAVGTLAGGIAHEFNNILSAMLGYGEMSLKLLRKNSSTRQYVQEILAAGLRAKHIIDQILTLSRKRERTTKPIDVVEVVQDIVPLLRVSLPDNVDLRDKLSPEPAVVVGNPLEIQQIIMNLAKNAAEAMDSGGAIDLAVEMQDILTSRVLSHGELSPGRYVRLSVADSGDGICETDLPHIFEPFFTTKSQSGGTGLGLAAVHGHIVASSGQIDVTSEDGLGTRFDIYLPATDLAAIAVRDFFDEPTIPVGSGETIAVVDGNSHLLLMAEEKLAALGYEPIGFPNVDGLVEWTGLNKRHPDLVILDATAVPADQGIGWIEKQLAGVPYLVTAAAGKDLANLRSKKIRPRILRKPVDTRAMAMAIHSRIKGTN